MEAIIIIVFVLGYATIAFEHPLRINKAAPALLIGMVIWSIIMIGPEQGGDHHHTLEQLFHHLGEIGSILFFLLGAMTVVELMDAHDGFGVITERIRSTSRRTLLWVIGLITFLLSAALDNLTTAVVMSALLRKLMKDRDDQWIFGGAVVIAANAGGAWSPIGDVTTIMLWVGGQVSTAGVVKQLLLPSLVCLVLPLTLLSARLKGAVQRPAESGANGASVITRQQQYTVFLMGVLTLLGVPLFKGVTHLPPFMGIMFGLSLLWIYTEFIHTRAMEERGKYQVSAILQRIDHSSVLFFLGILLAVSGLSTAGYLGQLADWLTVNVPNVYAVNGVLGVLSAVVDNVPLVAAAQGMYPLSIYPMDSSFWELLALCAGTGGSMLIIGSAAGVAVMGVLGVEFMWYLKRLALPALVGYLGGIATYWVLN